MRLALALVCLTLGLVGSAAGQDDAFLRGVEAYRRGDHEGAALHWRSLLDEPLPRRERARIAYDLGNAAWRRGEGMEAVAWYTSSVRLDPRNEDAWANLELVRGQLGLGPAMGGDLRSTILLFLTRWTPRERAWLAIGATLGLGVVLLGEALRGGRAWRRAALLAVLVLLVCLGPWIHGAVSQSEETMMVVRRPSVALRAEPREDLAAIAAVAAGVEVGPIDELPGWVRLEDEDGVRGWVPADAVFPLLR